MGDFQVVLVFLIGIEAVFASCPSNSYAAADGFCYISANSTGAWGAAENVCSNFNANLVVPRNAFENTAFSEVVRSFGFSISWLGAFSDQNSNWYDENGTIIVYDNFGSGQKYNPNKCAYTSQNGIWYASDCLSQNFFICRLSSLSAQNSSTTRGTTPSTATSIPLATTLNPSNCPGYTTLFSSSPCMTGWYFFLKTCSCYLMTTSTYSFYEAEQHCINSGGNHVAHLTSIHSDEEALYIMSLSSLSQQKIQVGLQYVGNQWFWTDGSSVDYLNWAPRGVDDNFSKNACTYVLGDGYYFASFMGNGQCTTRYSHAVCRYSLM